MLSWSNAPCGLHLQRAHDHGNFPAVRWLLPLTLEAMQASQVRKTQQRVLKFLQKIPASEPVAAQQPAVADSTDAQQRAYSLERQLDAAQQRGTGWYLEGWSCQQLDQQPAWQFALQNAN